MSDICKHCGLAIDGDGKGNWRHSEGPQRNLNRCAINPYGFNACPPDEPCDFTCNAYRGIEVTG